MATSSAECHSPSSRGTPRPHEECLQGVLTIDAACRMHSSRSGRIRVISSGIAADRGICSPAVAWPRGCPFAYVRVGPYISHSLFNTVSAREYITGSGEGFATPNISHYT